MRRRETTPDDIREILKIVLSQDGPSPDSAKIMATATRQQLVIGLRAFGEDAVAARVSSLSDADMRKLYQRAGSTYLTQNGYVRSLCLAAIEVVEGQSRPLARKRRKRAT